AEELELRERDAGETHRSAGEAHEVGHQDRRDDPDYEGDDGEVVAAQAQRRHAHDEPRQRRRHDRRQQPRGERPAALHEDRRGVGAHAHERRVPQRYQPGAADQDVEAHHEDHVDGDDDQEVLRGDAGEHVRRRHRRPQPEGQEREPHSFASCAPNRPRGRTSSTATISTKAVSSAYWTLTRPPVRFSAMPTISAPTIAPGTLPMPPKMTIANALITTIAAMLGSKALTAEARVPAAPASAPASANAATSTRNGSRPTTSAPLRFCDTARSALPTGAKRRKR